MNQRKKRVNFIVLSLVAIAVNQTAYSKSTTSKSQDFVECTGWHALCTSSPDCKMNGDRADCDCLKVNESHIIATDEIQDTAMKIATHSKCTEQTPCSVDQAPVCQAIQDGTYEVNQVRYPWVSTYSYRGWCGILKQNFVACDPTSAGYQGDRHWAICDAAPCVEKLKPNDPNKPLSCQCRVDHVPFAAFGSCTGVNGGIMSSMPLWAWDFNQNTYSFPMPGYDYVKAACDSLQSDQPKMRFKASSKAPSKR